MALEGSFWDAFSHSAMSIEDVFEKDKFTLEEVLDHDDLIQECKYLNRQLVQYLSHPSTLDQLIRYLIQKPPSATDSEDEDKKKTPVPSKYPYLASEIFACEITNMLDSLFQHPELLNLLFTFLHEKPPLHPSTVGYFRKVVAIFISKKFDRLIHFIETNGVLDLLINHIGLYSILELLIMIGWDDSSGQIPSTRWLYEQNLIPKLIAKLDPTYEKEEDVHVNAARALVDMVVKTPLQQESLLITSLTDASVLKNLFRYMLSGSRSCLTNCLSIVIALVQREANLRSLAAAAAGGSSTGTATSAGFEKLEDKDKDGKVKHPDIIENVLTHLPSLVVLLKENQDTMQELPTQYGSLKPPLGEIRLKLIELFVVLLRGNYPEVNEKFAKLNALNYILDLFFQYEWNNMLHSLVESLIRTILDLDLTILKKALFNEAKFLDRVLEAYAKNDKITDKRKGLRLGYMGHVVRICGAMAYFFDQDIKMKENLLGDSLGTWDKFVFGPLQRDNQSYNGFSVPEVPEAGGVATETGTAQATGSGTPEWTEDGSDTIFHGDPTAILSGTDEDIWATESLGTTSDWALDGGSGSSPTVRTGKTESAEPGSETGSETGSTSGTGTGTTGTGSGGGGGGGGGSGQEEWWKET